MLLEPNTVVVVLKGRFAGKKGIVTGTGEDGGRVLVAGIQQMPKPVTEEMSAKRRARASAMKVFIKNYNPNHLLATRYRSDVGIGGIDFSGALDSVESKRASAAALKKAFEDAGKQKKARWLFEKLVF